MQNLFNGWAPPMTWGPWIDVDHLFGGATIKLKFKTQSNVKSSFTVEVEYWNGQWQVDTVAIPGSGEHTLSVGNCACSVRARLKSHSVGQNVSIERVQHQ